jgi:glycosyltransferase involved in cell wall biosynthesis
VTSVWILHVDTGRQMRGGQHQVLYLMRGLAAAGVRSTLLAPAGSPLLRAAAGAGLEAGKLSAAALWKLARQVDLVHAHTGRAHTLGAVFARRPLVVSRRVAFAVKGGPASRWKYRRAAHFLAVSRYVAGRLLEARIPQERISVVYDGVPLGAPSRLEPFLVAPATDDPRKGTRLVRQAAAMAGVEVRFSGNLEQDLARACGLIYISEEEGLGSAVLLAMARAVPVVASAVGGLPEAVEDGRTGLLVGNSPEEIAAAMRWLLEEPAAAAEMGCHGRLRLQERFTVEKMVQGTLEVYRRLAG